ncbi:MAG: TatD family hydrolase, partial [Burkholderiaceae bacterium]|nr:TatD family hydrolase [Burkholderiaceae bacterium]
KLGFGGALTYTGSHRIRRHAATLGEQAWVLETDAPYIAPSWRRSGAGVERTEPCDLPRIAGELAQLRGIELAAAARCGRLNAVAALPRLGALLPSTD